MIKKFAVIGLGRFGQHLAVELARKGAEVLAIDAKMDRLDDIKDQVTHTVCLDSTEIKALQSQGITDYDAVIVGMGENFEACLLTVAALQQLEVRRIIVRATTSVHERILNHLGITEVILPAEEAADRLSSSLMVEGMVDSFAISSDYNISEINTPDDFIARTVGELDIHRKFGVTLVAIRRMVAKKKLLGLGVKQVETIIGTPQATTMIERGDILVIFGKKKDIESMMESK
ncbi:MAG: TrkA family potassium uptake protein [Ignavibacteriae bacterium]|nr:TrkA family potassium uptake protein [Ignavibacteriota bacterium]